MIKNPYPQVLIDEAAGVEVPDIRHQLWEEGYKAGHQDCKEGCSELYEACKEAVEAYEGLNEVVRPAFWGKCKDAIAKAEGSK